MRFALLFVIFFGGIASVQAQIDRFPGRDRTGNLGGGTIRPGVAANDTSSVRRSGKESKRRKLKTYSLSLYKFYSEEGDTVSVDTLLRPENHYQANFLQKDLFGFLPFQNIGQPLNVLGVDWNNTVSGDLVPKGKPGVLRGKDLTYYHVPTPYSRLFFLSGNNQGQMLDSRFGTNITKDWNLGFGYRGLSSLGYYRHSVSDHQRWFFNTEWAALHKRLRFRFFLVKNHFENDENGGLTDENLFLNSGSEFLDRGRIPVKSEEDRSIWHSRETGFSAEGFPVKKDSAWSAGYAFRYLKAYFAYKGSRAGDFGETWPAYSKPFDSVGYRDYRHDFFVKFKRRQSFWKGGFVWRRFFQTFDTVVGGVGRQHFRMENTVYFQGEQRFSRFGVKAGGGYEMRRKQQDFYAEVFYRKDLWKIWFKSSWQAKRLKPVYETWQSRFKKFTWDQYGGLTKYAVAEGGFAYGKSRMKFQYQSVRNAVYFGADSLPHAWTPPANLLAAEAKTDWQKGRFGFYARLRYQQLLNTTPFDVPQWTVRGMIYYTDFWFKKHMWMMAGVSVDWFSSFYMPGYNPLLNEFFVQRKQAYGNFYIADLFFDFKVKKFRAYLKWAHFNALWERYNPSYFSAPGYPYADAFIRLGVSWEFVN